MSRPQIVRELEDLESVEIRGQLSIEDLVRRQIDRCNMSMGSVEPSVFEAHVRALMTMLPSNKFTDVMNRSDEYNKEVHEWHHESWCGIQMGTPENPITTDDKPPKEDWSNVISPRPTTRTETDYEKLYKIVLQAFESVGLTWKVEQKVAEFGKIVETPIPSNLVERASQAVVDVLLKGRAELIEAAKKKESKPERRAGMVQANQMSYADLVEQLRDLTPPTPVFEVFE
jgi:hypothetical protein